MLELHGVRAAIGRHEVLHDVELFLPRRSLAVVSGANGAGKTTLLRTAAGLLPVAGGRRSFRGRTVAYVPGAFDAPAVAGRAWATVMARTPAWADALARLGFEGDLDRPCTTLSFGNLRKLAFAAALGGGSDLIIVDELSAGLDDTGRAGVVDLLHTRAAEGAAVLASDQESAPPLPSASSYRVHDGRLHAVRTSPGDAAAGDVAVTFVGPRAGVDELRAAASRLGFAPAPAPAPTPAPTPTPTPARADAPAPGARDGGVAR